MVVKKLWNILVHAFDDSERFLVARAFRVECTFSELDRLIEALSDMEIKHDYYRTRDAVIWQHLTYIRQYFDRWVVPQTLRVMHFSENQS